MNSPSYFPPLASRKTLLFVIDGSTDAFGFHWGDHISVYIDRMIKRLSEGNYPHPPLAPTKIVAYSALIDSVYTDGVIRENPRDLAALRCYMSVIETMRDYETRQPNEFSFFLLHVAAGQHGSSAWDSRWETICDELKKRHVNLSMVLFDDYPLFGQLFSRTSSAASRITPRFLLSGFMPPGELAGAMPSTVTAAHPVPLIPVPSTIEGTPWDSLSESPTTYGLGTPYPDDQCAGPPHFSQHPGSSVYAQGPEAPPFFHPYGGPQASGSAAVPGQPYFNQNNTSVPEIQGLPPVDWAVPPQNGGVEQQQATFRHYTENIDFHDVANPNARSMSSGSSDEMPVRNNEWTGTLKFNGTRVPVRALMDGAIGDPKLSALPNELPVEVEPAVDTDLSTLSIQVWIRKNKAPMVLLDGTENCDFGRLVEEIRTHRYAIVTWENRDRLLLAPLGKFLLCAAFPEKGTPKRPTSQEPTKVRTLKRKETPQKTEGSGKKLKQSHRPSKSSNGSCDGRNPEAAAQRTMTMQQPRQEQPQFDFYAQVDTGTIMQGEIYPPNQLHQADGIAQRPTISLPQFPVQHHDAYLHAPPGVTMFGAHPEQLAHRQMDTSAADCMADQSSLNSEDTKFYMMYDEYVNNDGCGVFYDGAS